MRKRLALKIENYAKIQLPNFSARAMRDALRETGADWRAWAAGAGLNPDTLEDPSESVTGEQEIDLQEAFAKATSHIPGLWFRLGQRYRLLGYGHLGAAALTADTFEAGMKTLEAFGALTYSLIGFPIISSGSKQVAVFAEDDHIPDISRAFCQERVLSSTVRVLNDMHPSLRPIARVETPLPLTEERKGWQDALGVPIMFEAAATRFILRDDIGSVNLPMADQIMGQAFSSACRKAINDAEAMDDMFGRLYRLLLRSAAPYPGAATASKMLGLSERSLHRRLAQQSLTFSDVLGSVRRQRATALLNGTEMPLDQIASMLGYSEPSSFSRAYKQWTGMRPAAARRMRHEPSSGNSPVATVAKSRSDPTGTEAAKDLSIA